MEPSVECIGGVGHVVEVDGSGVETGGVPF